MKKGDYSIGSEVWNGSSKFIEECGELLVVIGKMIGNGGNLEHWSGNLYPMFLEEIADVEASIEYFKNKNFTDEAKEFIEARKQRKLHLYEKWNEEK